MKGENTLSLHLHFTLHSKGVAQAVSHFTWFMIPGGNLHARYCLNSVLGARLSRLSTAVRGDKS